MAQVSYTSPIGPLALFDDDGAVVALDWGWLPQQSESPLLTRVLAQLDAYFSGTLDRFDVPLRPEGTPFQQRVWVALRDIPRGETRSYGELANSLGTSPRAIGTACARNPIPLIIPCHRVVARNGGLGGYSGSDGVETKRALLHLEGIDLP